MKETYTRSNARTISGIAVLISTVISVTPLCGLLFQCGCDWPWAGLDAKCNFYKPGAHHHCPWCASPITGIFSTGLAITGGVLTAMTPALPLCKYRTVNKIAIRILVGLTVFLLMAILTAGLAALGQNYSLGVGRLFFQW